jgi:peptide/nickel transport system substrate-binding protein
MQRSQGPAALRTAVLLSLLAAVLTAGCRAVAGPDNGAPDLPMLRVGVGGLPAQTGERGIQQFVSNISNEGLLRVDQEGRPEPWLAQAWRLAPDAMRLTIDLRRNVTFHDGSPVNAQTVVQILRENMPKVLGSSYEDIESISADGGSAITFRFRRPSTFVAESLIDVNIQKPRATAGGGTGPFFLATPYKPGTNAAQMTANANYYLGHPVLSGIAITAYPNIRAAWAELLRNRLDMLYEVSSDAIGSLRGASAASLYTFERPYQYVVLLNPRLPKLKARAIRVALNQAIDRPALVRDALEGHGTPSAGPVSQHHWAFQNAGASFTYAPAAAAAAMGTVTSGRMSLTCLTPAGSPYERLALVLKQQLREVGVDMSIAEVSPENLDTARSKPEFEALLIDAISGWSLFRPSTWWHSTGSRNAVGFSSAPVDAALDRVRHAANDDEYRTAAAEFQKAVNDDPPAIFLAWGERSRAVSSRFDVQAQSGRDVLASLRLWRPMPEAIPASRN